MATTQGNSADKATPSTTPAAKQSPGRKTTARKATAAKPAAPKSAGRKPAARKTATSAKNRMGAEERYRMVEVAAYFLAERNNYSGSPVDYWSQAEAQIAQLLGK